MSTKIVTARSAAALNTLIAAEILAGNSPVGVPQYCLFQPYPELWTISISVVVGNNAVTSFKLLSAATPAALSTLVNTEITGGAALMGGHTALPSQSNTSRATYFQATYKGSAVDAGQGSASASIGSITGLQAALDAKADLSGGKVPVGQLPVATNAAKGIVEISTGMTVTNGVATVP